MRARGGRGSRKGAQFLRRGFLFLAAAALLAAGVVLKSSAHITHGWPGAGDKAGGRSAAAEAPGQEEDEKLAEHPLFSRIDRDLEPFKKRPGGITLQMVEQAYCQGSKASFRLQVVNGSAYVVGESPSYESRLLSIKRQLLPLWLAGQLPEGLDVVIEQEDSPTVLRNRSAVCAASGPVIAPAKQPSNASHAHVLLAPDHTFAGWLEAHTLDWEHMLPLLQRAAEKHPWGERSPQLFFRGAATGVRNTTDPALAEAYAGVLDIRLVNWTSLAERPLFVPLSDHCRYKLLLHLAGNTYAARLKYLLACGSAVVMPESGFSEFWYHLLRPGDNILFVDEVDSFNGGHHLADVAQELQQDDDLAKRVGAAGAALAADALKPAFVPAFWRLLLRRYRSLQGYNATGLHPDAVPLERSILVPELRNVTSRTCPVCHPTPEQLEAQLRADLGLTDEDPLPQGRAAPG